MTARTAEVLDALSSPTAETQDADARTTNAVPDAAGLLVTVVVPTCGRKQLLRRCLTALVRQTLPVEHYEIIVVDDGRSADTRSVVESFAQRPGSPALLCMEPESGCRGPAAARNAGWRRANAAVIAFTDDDTVPARDWLEQGLAGLPEWAGAAAGRVRVPLAPAPTDWQRTSADLEGAEFVTANCFVRRAALVMTGGFDERFRRPWREDSDLHFALLERGYRVAAAPAAVVLHPVRPASWGVSLKTQRNMVFDALLYKKHRALYRSKIAPLPPLRYYAVVTLLMAGLVALGLGAYGAATILLSGWLAWTIWFTAFRLRGGRKFARDVIEMAATSAAIPVLAVFWRLAGAVRYRVWFA